MIKTVNEDGELLILKLLNKKESAVSISKLTGYTTSQVYRIKRKHGLNNTNNKIFSISTNQEQIFLSGRIGDGNYKKNGKYGFLYRASHCEEDIDYLQWQVNILKDMVTDSGILKATSKGWNKQQMYYFSTKTSRVFAQFKEMEAKSVIQKLSDLGLILYILDDGWMFHNAIKIAHGKLNIEEIKILIRQFQIFGFTDVRITTNNDIYIPTKNNRLLKEIAYKYSLHNLNIVKRKILSLVSK